MTPEEAAQIVIAAPIDRLFPSSETLKKAQQAELIYAKFFFDTSHLIPNDIWTVFFEHLIPPRKGWGWVYSYYLRAIYFCTIRVLMLKPIHYPLFQGKRLFNTKIATLLISLHEKIERKTNNLLPITGRNLLNMFLGRDEYTCFYCQKNFRIDVESRLPFLADWRQARRTNMPTCKRCWYNDLKEEDIIGRCNYKTIRDMGITVTELKELKTNYYRFEGDDFFITRDVKAAIVVRDANRARELEQKKEKRKMEATVKALKPKKVKVVHAPTRVQPKRTAKMSI